MRVSIFEQYNLTTFHGSKVQSEMAKQAIQITTGKEFLYPSDNPTKMNQSLLLNNSYDKMEQLQKNLGDTLSFLERTESVLGQVTDILQDTRANALLASSDQFNAADKKSYVTVIENNINQVLNLANTKHLNRYIFSGEKTQTQPFTYDGANVTYNGDGNNVSYKVGDGYDMEISKSGDVIFEDVLKAMIELRNAIENGTDVTTALQNFDKGFDNVIDTRTEFGIRVSTLELMEETYENSLVDIKSKISNVEDIDLAKVYSEYTQNTMFYQATIQASLKMMEASIINYI